MDIKKVAIIERNREQGQLLADYLKKRNLDVTLLDKIRPIIGAPVIDSIMHRLESLVSPQYSFMRKIKFHDYIYAFIHLVRTLTSDVLVERWDEERG